MKQSVLCAQRECLHLADYKHAHRESCELGAGASQVRLQPRRQRSDEPGRRPRKSRRSQVKGFW